MLELCAKSSPAFQNYEIPKGETAWLSEDGYPEGWGQSCDTTQILGTRSALRHANELLPFEKQYVNVNAVYQSLSYTGNEERVFKGILAVSTAENATDP